MIRCIGVDEAGFGPRLGPLVIASVAVDIDARSTDNVSISDDMALALADVDQALAESDVRIADSKAIYRSGKLAALEQVALAGVEWLVGVMPQTAAELFALFAETAADRDLPWMAGADELSLPSASSTVPALSVRNATQVSLSGRILHPRCLNEEREQGVNRAAAELAAIQQLLSDHLDAPTLPQHCAILVDRLGGRRYYAEMLESLLDAPAQASAPSPQMRIIQEQAACSSYAWTQHNHCTVHASFSVKADANNRLVALASCIAKYVRELHMHLLNTYWCRRYPWLKPTAGYPADAQRWLFQLGSGLVDAWRRDLVRC